MAEKTHPTGSSEAVKTYPRLYLGALLALFAVYAAIGSILLLFGSTVSVFGTTLENGILVWEAGLLHFIAGMRIIDANKSGGVFVLGWMTRKFSGTIVCVPPGIFWLLDYDLLTQEIEIPAEPQHIWREESTPPKDRPELRPPVRITFAKGTDKNDPLQHRVTEEVSFFVRLRVEDFFKFYVRVGSIQEARRQLEDVGVSYLAEVLPKDTLSDAITKIDVYSKELKKRIDKAVDGWGVSVPTVRVKQFPLSKSLNSAIQKMAESGAKKISGIIDAELTKETKILEGQGTASAIKAELDARTDGMKKMADDLKVDGKDIVGAETARKIGESPSTKIVLGTQGLSELIGAGATIARNFAQKNP